MSLIVLICCSSICFGQSKEKTSSELYNDLLRLSNSATVMYVAAHPDDENTRMISWLTNARHVNTVYLSLTRGDGGQNLIGTEKGDLLGVLRTQELLEARKVDKGNQWFTRAVDFGYSKTATETLSIWDKDLILSDVVWAIRLHRPDVMITRFDPDSNGRTHGHHTSSAILAVEAFDLAADPTAYPEQLKYVDTWQPKRLYYNTGWWQYGSREAFDKLDKSDFVSVDVGEYYPTLGLSNNEIASLSRSKHACQGFGSALQRGSQTEWLKLLKGSPSTNNDLLQGIDTTWDRYQDGLATDYEKIISDFDFLDTEKTADALLNLRDSNIGAKDNIPTNKHEDFRQVALDAMGIYVEWTTAQDFAVQGDEVNTRLEVTNRSSKPLTYGTGDDQQIIEPNASYRTEIKHVVTDTQLPTYWLDQPKDGIGLYQIADQAKIGLPHGGSSIMAQIPLFVNGKPLGIEVPLTHKHVDPAIGEIYEPFYAVPKVAVNFKEPVYLFSGDSTQKIDVEVTSFADNVSGTVQIDAGLSWVISTDQPFSIANKGETQTVSFTVIPPKTQELAELTASAKVAGQSYFDSFINVDYDHIDKQFIFQKASAKIGRVKMNVPDVTIGYIQGSGDEVPKSLRQVGLAVDELTHDQWSTMSNYDVIMVGIRAFNTIDASDTLVEHLNQFAKAGGTVIVQYQTNRRLKTQQFSPYSLTLSRDRISQEHAELTLLEPKHAVFNQPNQISSSDFDSWVQERGLYFGSEWSDEFTPLLAGNDTGEDVKKGMLLVADVGDNGEFVYTGLSFFRELPAGVPGAYRLMMNLLALGEN